MMEKKLEPTPEMKAKIEAAERKMEEQGIRELSPDELNGVAGGQDCYVKDGVAYIMSDIVGELSVDELYEMICWEIEVHDLDTAISVAKAIWRWDYTDSILLNYGPETYRDTLKKAVFTMEETRSRLGFWGHTQP